MRVVRITHEGKSHFLTAILIFFFLFSNELYAQSKLVDAQAGKKTKYLYENLKRISDHHVLFGHQDDLAYGVGWWGEPGRSDVKSVAGSYPAVYGWELGEIARDRNLDSVLFEDIKKYIKQGYKRGGVITISWHMINPVTRTSSWDTTRSVYTILPGGQNHEYFKGQLDLFADFISDLKKVPVIFRPYHEHTGSWFWWGKGNCTVEEYVALWRFTVEYLRDVKGLHNLLFAYSTDVVNSETEYLERYPGDDYVDILGIDDYQSVRSKETVPVMTKRLKMIVRLAREKDKVAVFSETGRESIPEADWWTETLLRGIKGDPESQKIAYVMVWRNARTNHHYAPFPGHLSADNFFEFTKDPLILLEDELPKMYKKPKKNL